MKKITLFTLALFSYFFSPCQTIKEHLATIIEKCSSDSLLDGSMLIAKGDMIIINSSFGYKNLEKREMNTASTLYPIASLTKQFTSTAIMRLQEEGKLSIGDKIGDYVEGPTFMREITIKI